MAYGFYGRTGKRAFDLIAALIGLLLSAPVLLVLTILIKLTSRGPAFYLQQRVGQAGIIFRIVKFRTMFQGADRCGLPITCAGDRRITPVGRLLRRLKLDELPQLWNVLKGEMSLVGPRPEVPRYVDSYSSLQKRVLTVRPGITDPASILYRHEEDLLGKQSDPDRYYRDVVLPEKLTLNLEYLDRISFPYDLFLVLLTTGSILIPKWIRGTQ